MIHFGLPESCLVNCHSCLDTINSSPIVRGRAEATFVKASRLAGIFISLLILEIVLVVFVFLLWVSRRVSVWPNVFVMPQNGISKSTRISGFVFPPWDLARGDCRPNS